MYSVEFANGIGMGEEGIRSWERLCNLIYTAKCKYPVTNIMSEGVPSVLFISSLFYSLKYLGKSVHRSHCTAVEANGTYGTVTVQLLKLTVHTVQSLYSCCS